MALRIGVIGLGNMGAGMAATLNRKGFSVQGFDLSEQARTRLAEKGVPCTSSLKELVQHSDIIVLSLPKAEHVESVCLAEDGIHHHGKPGLMIIDTTTSTPEVSRALAAKLGEKEIGFIDAPVSGGPAGAAAGTMSMVVGATDAQFATVRPVLEAMSASQVHVGECGAGNVAKIANNMLCAAHLISTAEALSMAAHAGVDPQRVLAGINAGSGGSAVSNVSFPKWILNKAYDSGFTMGLMRKDVGLGLALADQLQLELPLFASVGNLWQKSLASIPDSEDFTYIVSQTDKALYSKGS